MLSASRPKGICRRCNGPTAHDNRSGYCAQCYSLAVPCVLASEGCPGTIGPHSRSRVCSRHRDEVRKHYLDVHHGRIKPSPIRESP